MFSLARLIKNLFGRPKAGRPADSDDFWYSPLPTDVSGGVTPSTAIQVATVLACVRVISETLAQLPLHLMQGRKRAVDNSLYRVLHSQPNSRHTSFEFRQMMQGHLCLRGNAYALKRYSRVGQVEALIPLHPDRMQVFILSLVEDSKPAEGKLGFIYRDRNNIPYKLTQDEMFRLHGLSFDGIIGISPITECRKSIELSSQAEEHGVKYLKNAAKPGGVIQFPPDQWLRDEEDHKRLKNSWRQAHTGDDLYSVAILEGGAEWKPMGLSNKDSEWLESRRFQVTEIARIFRVPPHMIATAIEHGNTYANVEQSDLDFVKHTMGPWFALWEQAIQRDLIDEEDGSDTYAKFALEGFLRADSKARAEFYEKMLKMAVYSPNEIRELEDMDPFDGGDVRYIPVSMVPMEMAGQTQQKQPPPVPPDDNDKQQDQNKEQVAILEKWIADIASRIHSAETRSRESLEKPTWVKRHREYISKAIYPILDGQSSAITEEILSGLNEEPSERYNSIVSLLRKGTNNGR